jgi:hypothetical protein
MAASAQEPASEPATLPASEPASLPSQAASLPTSEAAAAPASEPDSAPAEEVIEEVVDVVDVTALSSSPWQPGAWTNAAAFANLDRGLNVLLPRPTRKGALVFLLDHRANESFDKSPLAHTLGFGAGSIKYPLALRYGATSFLDVGLLRVNRTQEAFDVYELDARVRVLDAARHPLDLAARAGVSIFAQDGSVASGVFAQLLASRTLARRLTVGVVLLGASDSSSPLKTTADTNWSAAVGGLLDLRLASFLAVDVELVANVAGYGAAHPVIAAGAKLITNRHTFALMLTNASGASADSLVANTPRGLGDLIAGFTLTREFD